MFFPSKWNHFAEQRLSLLSSALVNDTTPNLRSSRVVSLAAARLRAMAEGGPMALYKAYLRAHRVQIRAEERDQRAP